MAAQGGNKNSVMNHGAAGNMATREDLENLQQQQRQLQEQIKSAMHEVRTMWNFSSSKPESGVAKGSPNECIPSKEHEELTIF